MVVVSEKDFSVETTLTGLLDSHAGTDDQVVSCWYLIIIIQLWGILSMSLTAAYYHRGCD